jgi:hypothetical protein
LIKLFNINETELTCHAIVLIEYNRKSDEIKMIMMSYDTLQSKLMDINNYIPETKREQKFTTTPGIAKGTDDLFEFLLKYVQIIDPDFTDSVFIS